MSTPQELEKALWNGIESDRTILLGLDGREDGHLRPMTAQIEVPRGPIWFFTSSDNGLVALLDGGEARATAGFASKHHRLFACIHGDLRIERDRTAVDRLWNAFVAAWFEGGKDDPKLVLLRLDPDRATIWENESSMLAGVKLLFGVDPKRDYKDKVATVDLG